MQRSIIVPLRFSDIDAFGHVGHAATIALCQEHRNVMFAELAEVTGSDLVLSRGFVVAQISATFLRPIGSGAREATIEMTVKQVGRTSLTLGYRIAIADATAADITCVLVFVDDGGPRALSSVERRWFSEAAPLAA